MATTEIHDQQLENRRKAFDLADGWAKLLSGFATGTVILSATFIKDVLADDGNIEMKGFLYVSWAVLGLSAFLGTVVLGGLTANLVKTDPENTLDVYATSIRVPALFQIVTLTLGVALFAFFISKNL
jgi:hypothetical protein